MDLLMNKKITVKDIAQICNVSLGTVDRALNNRPGINEDTRRMILETVEKYGYHKNKQAISLASGKSKMIGVVVFNLNSEYFSNLIMAIETSVKDAGYTPVFMFSGIRQDQERECVNSLLAMNVDGIIVCSCMHDPLFYHNLRRSGVPVVAVGNRIDCEIPYVGIDDFAAMYDAAGAIMQKSYTHIVYISPVLEKGSKENIASQRDRYQGFCKAVSEHPHIKTTVINRYDDFEQQILDAVKIDPLTTAILCGGDNYTITCLKLLKNEIKPYGKIGLHGFDHIRTLQDLFPHTASVAYPSDAIGKAAVELVLSGKNDDIIIEHTLVSGNSI